MRGKKVLANTAMSLVEEMVAIICSFVLPRLILSVFGSQYNGLTTSISQFLGCAVLLRSGIGGATRAALYKPLADHDKSRIDSILKATDVFMKKTGLILAVAIVVFAWIYAFLVSDEFEWFFTFSLFLIIGISTFAESFFGITYLILLQADQKVWVSSMLRTACYLLNTILAVVLISGGASIHIVKFGSTVVYVLQPVMLSCYVRKKYKINTKAVPDDQAIAQRWASFWHQIAAFVMENTDVMVLTLFTNMLEVSVYSVYNLVVSGLKQGIVAFYAGLEAAFGNMIANGEDKVLRRSVSLMEFVFYSVSTIVYICAALLILPFVDIYTKGIEDVDYRRPWFVFISLTAQFFNGIRLPYQAVVQAAGHYKQTRNGAIIEPIINIVVSVIMVIRLGLVGVAIGTLVATVFRTIQYSTYMSKYIMHRKHGIPLLRCIVSFSEAGAIVFIVFMLKLNWPETYIMWFFNAGIVFTVAVTVTLVGSFIFFREDLKGLKMQILKFA